MPLSGRKAALKITGTPIASTNNACTRSTGAGTSNGVVSITASSRRHWDDTAAISLYRAAGGTTSLVGSSQYTVDPVLGRFNWKTGDPSTGTYTADVSYMPATAVLQGRSWELSAETEMLDVSTFGSAGWREWMPDMTGAQVTVGRFWADAAFFDRVSLNDKFVVELYPASTQTWKYEGFARIAQDQIQVATGSIVAEAINMVVDGHLRYST